MPNTPETPETPDTPDAQGAALWCCTDDELRLLVPLDELDDGTRGTVTRWLLEHEVTPSSLEIGAPVHRDEIHEVLAWRERRPDGSVVRRWLYHPPIQGRTWPRPFPPALVRPPDDDGARPPASAAGVEARQGSYGAPARPWAGDSRR
ncbi:hypothetical protein [Nocardioides plantarum]|uniref:Uncharacterized protein n=1 Tax=Nocardioides plantarum TaxID=29299 RepID=A0ABV5KD22_9ACTN|nr:hypothetical protein [Nocardioides plantarum]